jgi:hypothetical protein
MGAGIDPKTLRKLKSFTARIGDAEKGIARIKELWHTDHAEDWTRNYDVERDHKSYTSLGGHTCTSVKPNHGRSCKR